MKIHNHFAISFLPTFLVAARQVTARLISLQFASALLITVLLSTPVLAHKVILDAYVLDTQIEGELGFSNGDIGAFAQVHILDKQDNIIAKVQTDADGLFTYTPHYLVDHYLYVDLGAGHVANVVVAMDDLAFLAGTEQLRDYQPNSLATYVKTPATDTSNNDEIADNQTAAGLVALNGLEALTKDVRRMSGEVRELRKALNRYKEKNTLQQILGGLGYILGLVGLGLYMHARQLLRQQASDNEKQS